MSFYFKEKFKDSCVHPLMLREIKELGLDNKQAKFLNFEDGVFKYVIGNLSKRVVITFCSKRTMYLSNYNNAESLLDDNDIAFAESFVWYGYELQPGGHKYFKVAY